MRILLVSDLHYTLPQLDWVVRASPGFDLVVVAGDSLDISSAVPPDVQSVVLLRYFRLIQAQTRLVVSSGNHDLTGPDAHGEQCAAWLHSAAETGLHTDGQSLVVEDTLVTICPWWDGPVGQAALSQQLITDAARVSSASASQGGPSRWLWVYHWPPLGSPTCWTGRRDYGDAELPAWIRQHQPDVVLTGHVHESPYKPAGHWADRIGKTWVFNAGRQIGPVPAFVDIDLAGQVASWHSLMGEETLEMSADKAPERSVF